MLVVFVLNSNDSNSRNTRLSSLLDLDLFALKFVASQLVSFLNAAYSGFGLGSNLVVNLDYKRHLPDTRPMAPHSVLPPFDAIHLTAFWAYYWALGESLCWFSLTRHSLLKCQSSPEWDSK